MIIIVVAIYFVDLFCVPDMSAHMVSDWGLNGRGWVLGVTGEIVEKIGRIFLNGMVVCLVG